MPRVNELNGGRQGSTDAIVRLLDSRHLVIPKAIHIHCVQGGTQAPEDELEVVGLHTREELPVDIAYWVGTGWCRCHLAQRLVVEPLRHSSTSAVTDEDTWPSNVDEVRPW